MIYLLLTILDVALSIGIGIFVLLQDRKAKLNRSVCFLAFCLCFWQIANYLSDKSGSLALYWNRATFIGPITALYFSRVFLHNLRGKSPDKSVHYSELILTLVFCTFALFGDVISQVYPRLAGGEFVGNDVSRGSGYLIVIAWILYLLVTFLGNLSHTLRHSTGKLREQMHVILLGVSLAIVTGSVTNILIPILTNSTAAAKLAPLTGIIIMATFAYAIVRHGFLDIRSFVIRATVYVLSTVTLAVLYVAPLIYLMAIVVMGFDFRLGKFILGIIVGMIAAINYSRVKQRFDNVTSKIFFRDSYDSAVLLGEMNRALVSSVDLNKVLQDSADLIIRNLKSEFCIFALYDQKTDTTRVMGVGPKRYGMTDLRDLFRASSRLTGNIIDANFLPVGYEHLRKSLMKNDIAVLVRLSDAAQAGSATLGYMMLGFKKSGKPYDMQDKHTLETIGDVLIIAIQNALRFEEIQKFNETLQERITEATAKLRRTNAKLKALDETKDDFISMASHQLRTPLTSVKGYLSMVLEGDAGKLTPLQHKMLDQAFVSSQRMVFLIADLLNVSRLKTGKFVIEPVKVNLAKTVADEVSQLKETAKNRSLTLEYDRPENIPDLMLDETKIRQVIMNFIDNAIYYTPAGGTIRIELADTPSTVELRVVDNGIGVPKSEQPHLFTKFYRAGNARQARPDGTGLGLFMAKKVVVAQGGAIIYESREGRGSTFGFILPKAKLAVSPVVSNAAGNKLVAKA